MANLSEIRITQKRMLLQLLIIKDKPEKVDEFVKMVKTEMEAEDVAYVEKMAAEFKQ